MKLINIALLVFGMMFLARGHISWWINHEDVTVRSAQNIVLIIPGWAMVSMGYLGLSAIHQQKG